MATYENEVGPFGKYEDYDDDVDLECEECLGTGEICTNCNLSIIICDCDDPETDECPICEGSGRD